jgi:hypothetical protein
MFSAERDPVLSFLAAADFFCEAVGLLRFIGAPPGSGLDAYGRALVDAEI